MLKIQLPDGSERQFDSAVTGLDIAAREKMPEPRLDEEPVTRLSRIRIKRGERQRSYRTTFTGTISLS